MSEGQALNFDPQENKSFSHSFTTYPIPINVVIEFPNNTQMIWSSKSGGVGNVVELK